MSASEYVLRKTGIDVNSASPSESFNESTLLVLDDAQYVYEDAQFWTNLIKNYVASPKANLRILVLAPFSIGLMPEPPVLFTANQTMSMSLLKLLPEEEHSLFDKFSVLWPKSSKWLSVPEFRSALAEECGGSICALRLMLGSMDELMQSQDNSTFFHHLFSAPIANRFDRCYSRVILATFDAEQISILKRILFAEEIVVDGERNASPEIKRLVRCGLLVLDSQSILRFVTPIAKRIVFRTLFSPNNEAVRPTNMDDWLLSVFRKFSASRLLSGSSASGSEATSSSSKPLPKFPFPKENILQQEFYLCATQSLPPIVSVVPELNDIFGTTSSTASGAFLR